MAFTANITTNGRNYPTAYIKASITHCDTNSIVVKLLLWETQQLRENGVQSLPYDNDTHVIPVVDIPAANPIAYAYAALEASGEFPEATWNI